MRTSVPIIRQQIMPLCNTFSSMQSHSAYKQKSNTIREYDSFNDMIEYSLPENSLFDKARINDHTNYDKNCTRFECDNETIDTLLKAMSKQLCDPVTDNKTLGILGEQYTALHFIQQGWCVISRNWHTRLGELDLVMLTAEHTLVFIEVKTRRTTHFGSPQEAVTAVKQEKTRKTGLLWLQQYGNSIPHARIRFDVVSILVTPLNDNLPQHAKHQLSPLQFTHIPGAF